jgi:hypothetical protein
MNRGLNSLSTNLTEVDKNLQHTHYDTHNTTYKLYSIEEESSPFLLNAITYKLNKPAVPFSVSDQHF